MLEVRILGTAAGGGFPQWNCGCENCRRARAGTLPARMQSGAAVSADGRSWHLVNASPDVARQIEQYLPRPEDPGRTNPVASVFVTNADLDHTLGLFQLREGNRIAVTAPSPVARSLRGALGLERVLSCYGGVEWTPASEGWTSHGALEVRCIPLRGAAPPRYDRDAAGGGHAAGYLFRSDSGTAGIFPDVAILDDSLLAVMSQCDRVWFDGTFWSEDEMLEWNGRTASEMGHVPIRESLHLLARLGRDRVALLHINNTNPILRPDSEEQKAVIEAGVAIAEDGDRWIA